MSFWGPAVASPDARPRTPAKDVVLCTPDNDVISHVVQCIAYLPHATEQKRSDMVHFDVLDTCIRQY
jgi:hypothetical protein